MSSGPGWGLSGWGDPIITRPPDIFDDLLTSTCTIYRKHGVTLDKYGNPDFTPVVIEDNVPCRLSTAGAGHEFKDPKEVAIEHWKVFMRPRPLFRVSEVHFLRIETRAFNITSVIEPRDRASVVHHLELFVDEVLPSVHPEYFS